MLIVHAFVTRPTVSRCLLPWKSWGSNINYYKNKLEVLLKTYLECETNLKGEMLSFYKTPIQGALMLNELKATHTRHRNVIPFSVHDLETRIVVGEGENAHLLQCL